MTMQSAGDHMRAYNYLVPTVIESSNRGERAYDLYSRLLREQAGSESGKKHCSSSFQISLLPCIRKYPVGSYGSPANLTVTFGEESNSV